MDSGKTAAFSGGIPPIHPCTWELFAKIWYICRLFRSYFGYPPVEVIIMESKRHQQRLTEDLRLDPEIRLCPAYNSASIKKFYLPDEEMGVRVIDNCAEENMR